MPEDDSGGNCCDGRSDCGYCGSFLPTCAYNSVCQDTPDPGSIDGVCTHHRADAERYDDGEAWPR